jgi:hypothetical protein
MAKMGSGKIAQKFGKNKNIGGLAKNKQAS